MIFDLTQSYVPQSYVDSRDYRVFLRQLGMLLTVFKYNIDKYPSLYSADECPDHMLPLLASMVGYQYKDSRSIEGNRMIIKEYPYLIRYRGSEEGLRAAVILCINTSPAVTHYYPEDSIIISTDLETSTITIYYPKIEAIDWDLIEVVRPVGMKIILVPSDITTRSEVLRLYDQIKVIRRNKYFDQSVVDESFVGFSVNEDVREEE